MSLETVAPKSLTLHANESIPFIISRNSVVFGRDGYVISCSVFSANDVLPDQPSERNTIIMTNIDFFINTFLRTNKPKRL